MARTLTAANSAFSLQIAGLYPVPQSLQGYAIDDSFSVDDISPSEAIMGVDGKLSFGYTPYPTKIHVLLQADSDSNDIFDNWISAMQASREVYVANAAISLPGIGKKYVITRGVLTGGNLMAGNKRTLSARKFEITFESCVVSPI
jgi:hypothetical protein